METLETMARRLAAQRMERDRKTALDAGLPCLIKLEAYLPQCRLDAAVTILFSREKTRR